MAGAAAGAAAQPAPRPNIIVDAAQGLRAGEVAGARVLKEAGRTSALVGCFGDVMAAWAEQA